MKRNRLTFLVITATIAGSLLLAACTLQTSSDVSAATVGQQEVSDLPTMAPLVDGPATTECPDPTDSTALFSDEELGYCLLYPTSHTVVQLDSGNTEIVVGDVMNHTDPRISISTQELTGRTIEQVVEEFLTGYEGFEIKQTSLALAGEEAKLLDQVPGQDFYRIVMVAHNDTLYRIDIFPYDENLSDSYPQAEQLYQLVVDTFRFNSK